MDSQQGTALGGRFVAVVALATITTATALAFSRVFTEGATLRLLLAGWIATGIAVAFERRSLLLGSLVAGAMLLLLIAWLVFTDTLWLVLPTRETFDELIRSLGRVGPQARQQVSPTAPAAPLLVASITAVYAAAFAAHALAVRAASPILALAPSVALIAFADAALRGDGAVWSGALLLLGILLLFLADGLRRIRQWGPVRIPGGDAGRSPVVLARGAAGAAAATIVVAALLPGLLPGYEGTALVNVRSGPGGTDLDPLVSIGDSLTRDRAVSLFTVNSPRTSYWRLLALDEFDGETWRAGTLAVQGEAFVEHLSGDQLSPAGVQSGAAPITQTFEIASDLGFSWVPTGFPPTRVDLGGASFRFDPERWTVTAPEPLSAGTRYTTVASPANPTPGELRGEPEATGSVVARYTQLPETVPSDVAQIAAAWTADAGTTTYDRTMAIQERLRGPEFAYSTDVPARSGTEAIVQFLTRSREGFCQQFAGSMAVLLRSLGIPARIAVGFTDGTPTAPFEHEVSSEDAHAWVEVYFPTYGWLPFEPTKSRENVAAASYLGPFTAGPCTGPGCAGRGQQARGDGQGRGANDANVVGRRRANQAQSETDPLVTPAPPLWRRYSGPVAAALLGLALLFLLFVPPVKAVRRRILLYRRRPPRELILTTYDVFSARASDLGVPRNAGETMEEYGRRLAATATPADGPRQLGGTEVAGVRRLTGLAERAAYGPVAPTGAEVADARTSSRRAIRALRKRRGQLRNIWHVYRFGL